MRSGRTVLALRKLRLESAESSETLALSLLHFVVSGFGLVFRHSVAVARMHWLETVSCRGGSEKAQVYWEGGP